MSFNINYDETLANTYELPEVLRGADGAKITDAGEWAAHRAYLLGQFGAYIYGETPGEAVRLSSELFDKDDDALGGLARRRQVRVRLEHNGQERSCEVLIYLPKESQGPVPMFLGLNFRGNQSTNADPAVAITKRWVARDPDRGIETNEATGASRGKRHGRWPAEMIVKRGYGVATVYCGDFHEDDAGRRGSSVAGLFEKDYSWGAVGMWAWGLSRILDVLSEMPEVDGETVTVVGHSRLGKTSLWAGVQDERFAGMVTMHSGCMGASLSRRNFGETLERITKAFPHWFCERLNDYVGQEGELPIDQHMLLATAAPRPMLIGAAEDDLWADPLGMLLAGHEAGAAYKLFGKEGQEAVTLPKPNTMLGGNPGFYYRSGEHDVTSVDWGFILDWRDGWAKE